MIDIGKRSMNRRVDLSFTNLSLLVKGSARSIDLYVRYAKREVIDQRKDTESGTATVWLGDRMRPFLSILIENAAAASRLHPIGQSRAACETYGEVGHLCEAALHRERLLSSPRNSCYPIGYSAYISDPGGHTLELSSGQEVALTVQECTNSKPDPA